MKRWKSSLFLGLIAITMALGLVLSPALTKANPLTLQELIDLGPSGYVIDDKLFYNFDYTPSGTAPLAAQITATPIETVGNPGFRFNSLWSVTSNGIADSFLSYNVVVLPGGVPIKDVSASIGGFGQTGTGIVSLDENVYLGDDETGPIIATIHLEHTSTNTINFLEVNFVTPTLGPIYVEKDFGVVGGENGSASFSRLTNQFSEKIPEPISLILLGSGLAGVGLYRRFRKPKG